MNTNSRIHNAKFIICIAASAAGAVAISSQTALADQPPATRSAKVPLAGLDLSTTAGARAAYERIKSTAERLCFQLGNIREIDHMEAYKMCVNEALADAVRRINAPTVAALEK